MDILLKLVIHLRVLDILHKVMLLKEWLFLKCNIQLALEVTQHKTMVAALDVKLLLVIQATEVLD
jgi:hypothetical protein